MGWSAGANLALGAAARSDAVDAVALLDPPMWSLMNEQERAAIGDAVPG